MDLKLINNLKGNQIYNGQVLKIIKNQTELDSLLKRKRSVSYTSSQPVISRNKSAVANTQEPSSIPSLLPSTRSSTIPSLHSLSPPEGKTPESGKVESNKEHRSPPKPIANQAKKEPPQKITPPQQSQQPPQPKKKLSQVEEFYNSM